MMELQPVGTKGQREDAGEEDKSRLKRKHEDQDDSELQPVGTKGPREDAGEEDKSRLKRKHEDQDDSELQPVGTKGPREDAGEEDKSRLKRKHEDQDDLPAKKLVTDHSVKVASHYNSLQEVGLAVRSRSRIFFMRNFNNWLKSVLIGEILEKVWAGGSRQVSVLDLGCGKGGDLLKWRRGGISHLVCADIAAVSVEQCRSRYDDMKRRSHMSERLFSAQFITADCTKEVLSEKLDDDQLMFDICSCQFVYHYSFESEQKAEMMLRNACERLKPGGFFIGTTPDAFELVKRLEASDSLSFGNEVFNVSFGSKGPYPLFRCQYHFSLEDVVNVPEFLVYFPLFEHMAKRHNMRLVSKQRFSEFFQEKVKKEQHRNLMMKMMALEPFPGDGKGHRASDASAEYSHAEEHCSRAGVRLPVGTLSKSEWEATSIYLVFVFQKMS
ncbi:mRNA cap guanine-N7 methyltransferase [Takifugu flavidus]|uniref:mRNA cap guanine-N(7) methyltransferase n=1 Tax=Takifugu flavidus TaxID=433684 RepID=A0A5C6NGD8_9TELE|nr:mRNA cap guanine-N7 methyltransferase [Takifugu flavidus]XP_056877035.1 mRNA cap guanine-N7 methyltransferase [Takifugu flavidus]TWW65908.1 mRNA cap guanine-N7 methyltransferase [Takifugu flavidus]